MPESTPDQSFNRLTCDSIETKSLLLIDDNGCQRAQMSCVSATDKKPGHTVFHIYDATGAPKVTFQVSDSDGQFIALFNSNNNSPAISILSNPEQGNGITITNGDGHPLINLAVHGNASRRTPGDSEISTACEDQTEVWSVVNGVPTSDAGK